MIDEASKKTAVIINGKLCCRVNKMKNIFCSEEPEHIKAIERKLSQARDDLETLRRKMILDAFRNEVINFQTITGTKPYLCLMNYRDVDLLCDAWNQETRELGIERAYLNSYNSGDKDRFIDGIKLKKGCDQEPGDYKFYSAEE